MEIDKSNIFLANTVVLFLAVWNILLSMYHLVELKVVIFAARIGVSYWVGSNFCFLFDMTAILGEGFSFSHFHSIHILILLVVFLLQVVLTNFIAHYDTLGAYFTATASKNALFSLRSVRRRCDGWVF